MNIDFVLPFSSQNFYFLIQSIPRLSVAAVLPGHAGDDLRAGEQPGDVLHPVRARRLHKEHMVSVKSVKSALKHPSVLLSGGLLSGSDPTKRNPRVIKKRTLHQHMKQTCTL